jgi:hypothetical protein
MDLIVDGPMKREMKLMLLQMVLRIRVPLATIPMMVRYIHEQQLAREKQERPVGRLQLTPRQ